MNGGDVRRVLVLYGTTEGQTRRVAIELGIALQRFGVEAHIFMASPSAPGPGGYAGVIVAASLHAGKYQRSVREWLETHAVGLASKPGAFISVCLMARDPRQETQLRLVAIMREFVDSCGWMPAYLKPVAGALVYTQYGWLTRWFMKRMAARTGGDTDTSRDYEYTDWTDVRALAREFAAFAPSRSTAKRSDYGRPNAEHPTPPTIPHLSHFVRE